MNPHSLAICWPDLAFFAGSYLLVKGVVMKGNGMEKEVQLQRSLQKLERELYKSNSLIQEFGRLQDSLGAIQQQSAQLEKAAESSPLKGKEIQKLLGDTVIHNKFKELETNLSKLKDQLRSFEQPQFRTELFLEQFRQQQKLSFPSADHAISFLTASCHLFQEETLYLAPQIIGTADLQALSSALGLPKPSGHQIALPVSLLSRLPAVLAKLPKARLVLDTAFMRASFSSLSAMEIKASPETLRILKSLT